ncbi:MAG: universal stress protein [Spirochaetaceae bacterium]|nr:universal stress protein [Spirochaetaceae bacterium]
MFDKILLGFDGSEHAARAAAAAGDIARAMISRSLLIVAAFDPLPGYLGEPNFSDIGARRTMEADRLAEMAKSEVGAISGEITVEIVSGHAAEAILRVAEIRECDLIVLGSRGMGSFGALLLGSQCQKVLHLARCPVLVVR